MPSDDINPIESVAKGATKAGLEFIKEETISYAKKIVAK